MPCKLPEHSFAAAVVVVTLERDWSELDDDVAAAVVVETVAMAWSQLLQFVVALVAVVEPAAAAAASAVEVASAAAKTVLTAAVVEVAWPPPHLTMLLPIKLEVVDKTWLVVVAAVVVGG